MNWSNLSGQTAVALLALAASCGVQAQITKCIDAQGNVTYSDAAEGICRNAIIVDIAATTPAAASSLPSAVPVDDQAGRSQMLMITGSDAPLRQTAWANLPMQRQHASTDAMTVATAREALASTDRGLAAMRTQKVASSR